MQTVPMIIITTRAESAQYAIAELQKYDAQIRPVRELERGVRLMTLPNGWAQFMMDAPPLVFVRHIFPVMYSTKISGEADGFTSPNTDEIMRIIDETVFAGVSAELAHTFSVQVRGSVRAVRQVATDRLVASIDAALVARGLKKDVKHPHWVVSLFFHENEAGEGTMYAGVSTATANRSRWNGGAAHYANEGVLSRAAHKLTEALEVFGLAHGMNGGAPIVSTQTRALDLGAAPGGWTKVLLEAGAHVIAVDPGALDTRLANHPRLRYVCATAQRFFAEAAKATDRAKTPKADNMADARYDLIVNDMKMDMYESARIMCDAAFLLAPNGHAIMTLKLKPGQGPAKIKKALDILAMKYHVAGTRQLFHNRDEVTVCLTARI